jgi:hypothetical protein
VRSSWAGNPGPGLVQESVGRCCWRAVQCYVRGPVPGRCFSRSIYLRMGSLGTSAELVKYPSCVTDPVVKRILTEGWPSTYGQCRGAIYLDEGFAVTYSTVGPQLEPRGPMFWSVRPDDAGEERRL